ncbi:MAG: hypothetical protein ACRDZY_01890, partial [Acidimicrobiales bacterium]
VHQVAAGLTDPGANLDTTGPVVEGADQDDYRGPGQRGPLTLTVFSWSQFNPDDDPCLVYQFDGSGDLPAVEALANDVRYEVQSAIGQVNFPKQHTQFEPHVTAGFGLPPDALSFTGPVVFDRLRVALGGAVTDYPLGGPTMPQDLLAAVPAKKRAAAKEDGDTYPGTDLYPISTHDMFLAAIRLAGNSKIIPPEKVRKWLMARAKAKGWAEDIPDTWKPDGSLTASADTLAAPIGWFRDPELPGPTPLTVGDDGRVTGHLALWASSHIGYPGQNTKPPRSRSDYAYFHTGARQVTDGHNPQMIATGHITLDTGHAGMDADHRAAAAHYDNTGSLVADVCAGEDTHGIWVAGALVPGLDDLRLHRLRACGLSGDWRRIGPGLELVAALSVPTPGFPVPRSRVASGQPHALVAAGALAPHMVAGIEVGALADAVVDRLETRAAVVAAATKARDELLAELDDTDYFTNQVEQLLAELDDESDQIAASGRFTWE